MRRLLRLLLIVALIGAAWALLRELLGRPSVTSSDESASAPDPGGPGDGSSSISKAELYRQAQELDVRGRSKMSKRELAAAVAAAEGRR